MTISRRTVVGFAASFGLSKSLFATFEAAAQSPTLRVRENIGTFSTDATKVACLRAAVGQMKQKSKANKHDPFGWDYWAAIHGTNEPVPANLRNIYNTCDHSSATYTALHFVSWHRAYLFFFESVLKQAARDAGQTVALELPYWDWYTAPKLPAIFVSGNAGTNPLWHARKNVDLTGFRLDRSPFKHNDLLPATNVPRVRTFSYTLEEDPHGAVHGYIGREMGSVQTSARDPIFWLHHANIDRLWTAWMKSGTRVLPAANSSWGNTSWAFDEAGNWKQSAGPMLNSEASLKYRYDDESPPPPPPSGVVIAQVRRLVEGQASPVDIDKSKGSRPSGEKGMAPSATISSARGALTLGNTAVGVNLPVSTSHSNELRKLSVSGGATSGIKSASLVLEDVQVGGSGKGGGFSFRVVLSLVDKPGQSVDLGTLNTFTLSTAGGPGGTHSHDAASRQTLVYPLTNVLPVLGVTDTSNLEKGLRVTFEPSHPAKPGAAPDFIKIGAVKLNTSAQADQ
jgi:tyrosinase